MIAVFEFECSDNIANEHDLRDILMKAMIRGLNLSKELMHEGDDEEDWWDLHIKGLGIANVLP